MRFISLFAASAVVSVTTALTSSLQEVTAFVTGPTAAKMYIYAPANISTPAPIIVAVHYCTGSGPAYFSATKYASLADTHNFIVIYPSAPSSGGCWDVSSNTSLTHRSGGDSLTIVNMVSYAVSSYGGDASKVFVTGSSSGAMMTNVLAGAYPDIFTAGSVYSGVPDGCFYLASAQAGTDNPGWNSACSGGSVVKTAKEWGALVQSYYPGYTGTYPRMQMFVFPPLQHLNV
jgi:acetylxylan esterase